MVDHINNGEEGFSVREKLNTVIDRTNTLNGIENQVEANKKLSQQNSARIDKEIQDRIDADQELWDHVNDVEDQLENLDVSILDAKIDQEIADRIAGDEALSEQITAGDAALADQITEGDAALDAKIDSVESSLTDAITSGDSALQGQIDAIVAELGEGGTGAGMVISPTEPPVEDRVEGMQWLDSTTANVWIWDGEKWLEFPVKGVKGDPGEKGEDGDKGDKGDKGDPGDPGAQGDSFFTDISAETGNNTIERFGDAVWVTQFKNDEIFAGAKLGPDIFCSGGISSHTATFSGKATFGQPNAKTILNERVHIVGSDGPVLPSDYTGGGAIAEKDYIVVENNGNSNIALVGNTGSLPSVKFNVYDPDNPVSSYNGLIGYKDSAKRLEFSLRDYQYEGEALVAAMYLRHSGDPSSSTKSSELEVRGDIVATNTMTANKFVGDGSGLTGLGGGLPSGGYTYSGTITATDFIATSDERIKKNICTAPTGVIEKIRGVTFEWKESGQMSSGVIAQELEAVPELAHLVHYGEEDGTKHVSYLGLIGYLIEEVKSLKAELEALK